jgi:hypothetical protein
MPTDRRSFLQGAVGATATSAHAQAGHASAATLPKVRLGKHEISRLIVGANQFYGYAHFNRLYDQHMKEWYTSERVCQVLGRCERNGINTWQSSLNPRTVPDLNLHRSRGGKLQAVFIGQSKAYASNPEKLRQLIADAKPIAMAHAGVPTDLMFRAGEANKVREFLKQVRDLGILVGLSTHDPRNVERVEEENWDLDFFMTCMYNVYRTPEELRKITGELPHGEVYLEGDPARMCKVVRQTRKTCFAFKILAAGRRIDTPEEVDKAFQFAYSNIKPHDCVIVGMYPRYKDEVGENAARVRAILGGAVSS